MIVTTQMLAEQYRSYANRGAKIRRMGDEGKLYPISEDLDFSRHHMRLHFMICHLCSQAKQLARAAFCESMH